MARPRDLCSQLLNGRKLKCFVACKALPLLHQWCLQPCQQQKQLRFRYQSWLRKDSHSILFLMAFMEFLRSFGEWLWATIGFLGRKAKSSRSRSFTSAPSVDASRVYLWGFQGRGVLWVGVSSAVLEEETSQVLCLLHRTNYLSTRDDHNHQQGSDWKLRSSDSSSGIDVPQAQASEQAVPGPGGEAKSFTWVKLQSKIPKRHFFLSEMLKRSVLQVLRALHHRLNIYKT